MGTDVESLYPSLIIKKVVEKVRSAVFESDIGLPRDGMICGIELE